MDLICESAHKQRPQELLSSLVGLDERRERRCAPRVMRRAPLAGSRSDGRTGGLARLRQGRYHRPRIFLSTLLFPFLHADSTLTGRKLVYSCDFSCPPLPDPRPPAAAHSAAPKPAAPSPVQTGPRPNHNSHKSQGRSSAHHLNCTPSSEALLCAPLVDLRQRPAHSHLCARAAPTTSEPRASIHSDHP